MSTFVPWIYSVALSKLPLHYYRMTRRNVASYQTKLLISSRRPVLNVSVGHWFKIKSLVENILRFLITTLTKILRDYFRLLSTCWSLVWLPYILNNPTYVALIRFDVSCFYLYNWFISFSMEWSQLCRHLLEPLFRKTL